jgi:hypothetical protein
MALALPEPALAADWVLVLTSKHGDKSYIDRSSMRTPAVGVRRVWVL